MAVAETGHRHPHARARKGIPSERGSGRAYCRQASIDCRRCQEGCAQFVSEGARRMDWAAIAAFDAPDGLSGRSETFAASLRAFFLQKLDDIRPVLGIIDREHHLGSGDERLRIGEPTVERGLVPNDIRSLQSGRVVVTRDAPRLAAEDMPLAGADFVLVERMAGHAVLIDFRTMYLA